MAYWFKDDTGTWHQSSDGESWSDEPAGVKPWEVNPSGLVDGGSENGWTPMADYVKSGATLTVAEKNKAEQKNMGRDVDYVDHRNDWQSDQNKPPNYQDFINHFYEQHWINSGQPMNRPWNSDEGAIGAKASIDSQFQAAVQGYNNQYGTNLQVNPAVLGPDTQVGVTPYMASRPADHKADMSLGGFLGDALTSPAGLAMLAAISGGTLLGPGAGAAGGLEAAASLPEFAGTMAGSSSVWGAGGGVLGGAAAGGATDLLAGLTDGVVSSSGATAGATATAGAEAGTGAVQAAQGVGEFASGATNAIPGVNAAQAALETAGIPNLTAPVLDAAGTTLTNAELGSLVTGTPVATIGPTLTNAAGLPPLSSIPNIPTPPSSSPGTPGGPTTAPGTSTNTLTDKLTNSIINGGVNLVGGAIVNSLTGTNKTDTTAIDQGQANINAALARALNEDDAAGRAHADATQAFDTAGKNYIRQIQSYGVNPNSGKFGDAALKLNLAGGAADANAMNQARYGVRQAALGNAASAAGANAKLVGLNANLDAMKFDQNQIIANQARQGLAPLTSVISNGVANWFNTNPSTPNYTYTNSPSGRVADLDPTATDINTWIPI